MPIEDEKESNEMWKEVHQGGIGVTVNGVPVVIISIVFDDGCV